jgi:hypothetical protein
LAGLFVGLSALAIICSADAKIRCHFVTWKKDIRPVRDDILFRARSAISPTFIAQTIRAHAATRPGGWG